MNGGWTELKDLYFSVYDTDGKLLAGFELGASELVMQLDSRAVNCYIESNEKEVILGSCLIVQIVGGREERKIFLEKIPINEIDADKIFQFYERAREEIERIERPKFKVIGLWSEGDLERLKRQRIKNEEILEALIGKLIVDGEVRIKSSDLSKSISLIAEIIERLKGAIHLFKFAVSILPMKADVIIRPEDEQVDYDVDRNEIKTKEWEVFRKIYGIYKERHEKYRSKEEMSYDILREAVKRFPEEICALENKIGKMIEFCDDIQTLERLIKCVRNKGIRIRGEVAYTLIDKWAERVYGKNNEVEFFLRDLYEEEKEGRELTEQLIKKGVFWREVVKDAISAIYDRDENMLREFAGKSFKSKEFEGYVREALEDLMLKGGNLREFLRFILNNEGLIIGSCGEVLVNAIFNRLEEGERRKLWRKYEQELRNFGIEPEVSYDGKYQDKETLDELGLSYKDVDRYTSALKEVSEKIQGWREGLLSKWIPILLILITVFLMVLTVLIGWGIIISPLPYATPTPPPTPIVTVTYYSPTP